MGPEIQVSRGMYITHTTYCFVVVSGLGTSVSGIWSGDVNLGDGLLQQAYDSHKSRIEFLSKLGGTHEVNLRSELVEQLTLAKVQMTEDIDFVCSRKLPS